MKTITMLKLFPVLLTIVFFSTSVVAQDRSLDYYLSEGLSKSPLLRDYENQLKSGSIDSLLTLSAYRPQVDLTSQAMIAPAGHNIGYDEVITNGGNYTAVIGAKQLLFNKKARTNQLQNIDLLKQTIGVNKIITQADLQKGITIQYITAYADYNQLQFNLKMIELLDEQLRAVKYLVEAGIYQQTDLMNLSVNLKSQEIAYKQAFMLFKIDVALLNLLAGIVDTTTVKLLKPEIELTNPYNLQMSPLLMQSKIDSTKNSIAKTMIDLNYRPKIEAFADAGFMAIRPVNVPHNLGTSFGLNLSMPLYDGKQRVKKYKKIEIAEDSRKLYRNFYTAQYWQQHHLLTEQLRLTNNLIVDIKQQLDQQKELIDLYRIELEKGLVRFTDYIFVINAYTNTQNNLTTSDMNRMQLINQLNYLR